MTSDRELLGQAFDVLDNIRAIDLYHADGEKVLEAIRTRLAEPDEADKEQLARIAKLVDEVDPYPEAEPVAWMMVNSEHDLDRSLHFEPQNWHITWEAVPLYLHPPRPAVRLSDIEISDMSNVILTTRKTGLSHIPYGTIELCRAVESAVLKKNGIEVKDE